MKNLFHRQQHTDARCEEATTDLRPCALRYHDPRGLHQFPAITRLDVQVEVFHIVTGAEGAHLFQWHSPYLSRERRSNIAPGELPGRLDFISAIVYTSSTEELIPIKQLDFPFQETDAFDILRQPLHALKCHRRHLSIIHDLIPPQGVQAHSNTGQPRNTLGT